jgi:hypothetical protein
MIIELGNTLISDEIFTNHFVCHLDKCKGACCIEGDRGAPLENNEIELISRNIDKIKNHMVPEAIELLEKEGFSEGEEIDDPASNCLPNGACIFSYIENGIIGCAIEKAYSLNEIEFNKPISCHLYPIRLGKVGDKESLNYHEWNICKPACAYGKDLNVPLFSFLKPPLIRKFGETWYNELELVYEEYKNQFHNI